MVSAGIGSKLPDIEKGLSALRTQQLTQSEAEVKLIDAKLKQSRQFLDNIDPADPNAPQQYIAWHDANHDDPILGPVLAARGITREQSRKRIEDAIASGPQEFARLLNQSKLGVEEFAKLNKPIAVGRALMTPEGQTLAVAPAAPPAAQQEYDAAVKGGYKGTFFDFKRALAEAGRTPPQPSAPVAVVDPATGKPVYVSREQAISGGMTPASAMEGLPPKEVQKREAAYPQSTAAIQGIEAKAAALIRDMKALRDDPGLEQITGMVYGRTPSVSREGSRAQALYDKIVATGGFQMLQQMRDASKTGGALGNVSNQEGKQLQASFAALDRRQNTADVRNAIDQAISDIEGATLRSREAYDSTYSYRQGGGKTPAAGGGVDTSNPLLK